MRQIKKRNEKQKATDRNEKKERGRKRERGEKERKNERKTEQKCEDKKEPRQLLLVNTTNLSVQISNLLHNHADRQLGHLAQGVRSLLGQL